MSPTNIRRQLNLNITTRRVQQVLHDDVNFIYQKRLAKPGLLPRHKIARLAFAEKYKFWTNEWQSIIFSDEKKFNLDGPDGSQYYWRDKRRERDSRKSRNFGGGSLMIWGAFSFIGKTPICFISNKMNSQIYVELLDDVLINYADNLHGSEWIFQQDNASIHSSGFTKNFLQSRNITTFEWPACSPDLNPIENIWGILANRVYSNGRQFENIKELKIAIQEEWANLDLQMLQGLVNSMQRRLFQVILMKGGCTDY